MKNIDNVVPDRLKGPTVRWKQVLGGLLVSLQRETFRHLALLRSGGSRPPLEAVAAAGVDLSSPAVFAEAFAEFSSLLDQLEAALA